MCEGFDSLGTTGSERSYMTGGGGGGGGPDLELVKLYHALI